MSVIAKHSQIIESVIQLAGFCAQKGWVPATSGNFSVRNDDLTFAITVSGTDKSILKEKDVMLVDLEGNAIEPNLIPSAETLLHTQLYRRFPDIQAVAHVHSLNSSVISKTSLDNGFNRVVLKNWELLKALKGVKSHLHNEEIPIFENSQNIPELALSVEKYIQQKNDAFGFHGYLIAGHGLYTWGNSVEETIRHVEALDALLAFHLNEAKLTGAFK